MQFLQSTKSDWFFDHVGGRFCRVPRGMTPELLGSRAPWASFFELVIDDNQLSFTVVLNEGRTEIIRASIVGDEATGTFDVMPQTQHG
jgi:hypothetical protein